MADNYSDIQGLTLEAVKLSRRKYGINRLDYKKTNTFLDALLRLIQDPMLVLLLVASSIYFISGKIGDGLFLVAAIVFQSSISLYQYTRSKNALAKLQALSQPHCKVIRDGKVVSVASEDLVVGDSLMVEEGISIMADGILVHSSDFSVNESILTGESWAVSKDSNSTDNNSIYSGTTVISGMAIATINAIGNQTKLGKIGASLTSIPEEKTPLELQITHFVTQMSIVGAIVFAVVWGINYWHSQQIMNSLLQSLTLAMSILPEEIPVAFTTFMALGAWRLMKKGILVKQMKTVETLGSATVICIDKTGTLTENQMSLAQLYVLSSNTITKADATLPEADKTLIEMAMWASEPIPFDPMEVALHERYKLSTIEDKRPQYNLVYEYPLSGKPPMMTHIFEDGKGSKIIASKGAPETFLSISNLSETEQNAIQQAIQVLAQQGFRLLGVATSDFKGTSYPKTQQELPFRFLGLVAFYDPPKKNIQKVLADFYGAGITVKIITGDIEITTTALAQQVGFHEFDQHITGENLMQLTDEKLKSCVMPTAIYSRMFPEAKLKIINALKSNEQIVAMTGDGVNDGPALKSAHIGIAMGKKGTEIAQQAASLIIIDDDLSKMVEAIAMGRAIYTNLKKAIRYIISIHIPIILTVFIPLALGWKYPSLFSPIHIIFLEIIMGPTCSVIYENEPMEKNAMKQPPKALTTTFFNWKELTISIVQGLVITAGILLIYQYAIRNGATENVTRTLCFTVLLTANIFLTLINRSFYYSLFTTLKYKNPMVLLILSITVSIVGLLLYVHPLATFFEFEPLDGLQLMLCLSIGFLSVFWFEGIKLLKRLKSKKDTNSV